MRKLSVEELGRLSTEEFWQKPKHPYVLVLDNIRSLLNVGSVFRTADAFLAEAIYLCGITGKPPDREMNKTALGATETVKWYHYGTTLEAIGHLREQNYRIASIEQVEQGVSLENFAPEASEKYAFVFGNEVFGVEKEVVAQSDICIEIPQFGTKHSINISVAAGIICWDYVAKAILRSS